MKNILKRLWIILATFFIGLVNVNAHSVTFYYIEKGKGSVEYTTRDCILLEGTKNCRIELPPDIKKEKDYMLGWQPTLICDGWAGFDKRNFITLDNGPYATIKDSISKLYACFAGENINSPNYTTDGDVISYDIIYDANGGSGAPRSQQKKKDLDRDGSEKIYLSGVVPTKEGYNFVEWNTRKDGTGGSFQPGGAYIGNAPMILYAQWKVSSKGCYLCDGIYKFGYYGSPCKEVPEYKDEKSCLSNNQNDTPQQTPEDFTTPPEGTEATEVKIIQYYKITYDTNGGNFIDGTKTRVQYINGSKPVGTPGSYPIKSDSLFTRWTYNGQDFDFSQILDEGIGANIETELENGIPIKKITLKANYVEISEILTDSIIKCSSDTDILDAANKKCYSILKTDTANEIYTYTTYKYDSNSRFCYVGESGGTNGGIYFNSNVNCSNEIGCKMEGKKNITDGVYANYTKKDAWFSSTTCYIAAKCNGILTENNSCIERWDSIIYNVTDAIIEPKKELNYGDGGDNYFDYEPSNENADKEASSSPDTGDALIFIAWLVGFGALGYTSYYFIKQKKQSNI
ncbi:MAG: InlB B-repeat-containing protein [bacterium]|nr:InlB B-repeat-containing protein [bacterium]